MKLRHPIRPFEGVLYSLAPVALAVGLLALPRVEARKTDGTWRVCFYVGFVIEVYKCWEFGGEPKTLAPGGPCVPTCDPSSQSCPS